MVCNSTEWKKTGVNRLLLCSTPNCLRGCHLRCLGLTRVPRGDWFCVHCSLKRESSLNIPLEFQGPPVIPGSFLDIWAKSGALQFVHTKRLRGSHRMIQYNTHRSTEGKTRWHTPPRILGTRRRQTNNFGGSRWCKWHRGSSTRRLRRKLRGRSTHPVPGRTSRQQRHMRRW